MKKIIIMLFTLIMAIAMIGAGYRTLTLHAEASETTNSIEDDNNNSANNIANNKVIIYNTNPHIKYRYGESTADIAKILCDKLKERKVDNQYIVNENVPERVYPDRYESIKKLITDNVKEYEDYIIIDIGLKVTNNKNTNMNNINVSISDYNKEFSKLLLRDLSKQSTKYHPIGFISVGSKRNQDLSKRQLEIIIGDENMTKDDVHEHIESLANSITTMLRQ